jgi:hypothetical protein
VYWTQHQCKMEDVVDVLDRDWISHYGKASPTEIHRRLRSVYDGDAMHYVSSDARSVVLRAVKKTLVTGPTRPTSWATTAGTVKESVGGFLGQRCHNQITATCADIQEVKTRIRRVRRNGKMNQFLLLHDKARQYTSLRTREATATKEWTVFSHPP